jgi:uncharacterized protein (AIM24 family)
LALAGQFTVVPVKVEPEVVAIKTENTVSWEASVDVRLRQNAKQSAQIKKNSNKMEFFQRQRV